MILFRIFLMAMSMTFVTFSNFLGILLLKLL